MVQTLPRTPMPSTAPPCHDLLYAAQSGDANAIAHLIDRALAEQGVSVHGSRSANQLDLRLEGQPLPDQQSVVPFIQRSLMRLGIKSIRSVTLQAKPTDDAVMGWTYQFQLGHSPSAALQKQPEAESLVRVHGGDRPAPHNTLAIGTYTIHPSQHGAIVHHRSGEAAPIKRRPRPSAKDSCLPFHTLLDRQPETQDALSALRTKTPVEFFGDQGLGKSTLLRSLAHQPQIDGQFQDGIVYQNVGTQPIPDTIQALFDAFYHWDSNLPTRPTDQELQDAFRSLNGLVILDNVPTGSNRLLDLPGITLLMATETHSLRNQGQSIPMRGLPIGDAIALIEQRLGRSLENDVERQAAAIICRILKGHPLRIVQNVSPLRETKQDSEAAVSHSLQQLADDLQSGLSSEALTIRAATALPDIERRVLAVLAVFERVAISVNHLKALVGSSNLDLTCQILLERGLVSIEGDRYRIASNLAPYFQQIWDLTPWLERSLNHFTHWARQQEKAIDPLLDASDALWWLAHLSAKTGQWAQVLEISQLVNRPLMLGKRWSRWQQMWDLGLMAAQSMGDGAAEALAFHQLGTRALCLGDVLTAHTYLVEATQRRIALRDEVGAAVSQHNLNLLLDVQENEAAPAASVAEPPLDRQPPIDDAPPPSTHTVPPVAIAQSVTALSTSPHGGITPTQEEAEPPSPEPSGNLAVPPTRVMTEPRSTPATPPQGYSSAPQERSFPWIWIVVSAIAALLGGAAAFLLLRNNAPFSINPNSVTFPPQLLRIESLPRQLTITNTGAERLNLASIAFSEGDRRDFAILEESCTQEPLRPDEDCIVSLSFTPQEEGTRSARLRIADESGEYVRSVQVRGVGERAQVSFSPDGLAFDPILAGGDRQTVRPVIVMNDSAVSFSVGQAEITDALNGGFAIAQDGCAGQTLDPNDTCTVDVAFNPPGGGIFEANLAVRDATREYVWLTPLIGTGQLTAPTLSPARLSFGEEVIGRVSTEAVTITNAGASPLQISDISLTGDTGNFVIRGNTCTRAPIQPGTSCRVTVGFNPQTTRNYTANLVISDNAINSPRQITLIGQGARVPAPDLSPNPLIFGEQEVNTVRRESFAITNRSSQSIQIRDISMPQNDDFGIVDETCTRSTLAAGASCRVTVGFTPQGTGDRSATITIRDTATGSPRTVQVTGIGATVPAPQIISAEVTPQNIPAGERSRVCYRIANVESLSLRNEQTGQVSPLESENGCATITPTESTSYTLIAEGQNGQSTTRQVQVRVTNPDTTPPAAPGPVSPAGNEYVLCNGSSSVTLNWNAVSDESEPITYSLDLEQGSSVAEPLSNGQSWTRVMQQSTTDTQFNIAPFLDAGRISYRWRVSARDAAGNASEASPWLYFRTCE